MPHHRHIIHADAAPAALGPYSHGAVAAGLLFCSGQIPLDPETGELVEGGVAAQTRRCLESLAAICDAAGAALGDAVRITVYLDDLAADWAEVNEAYGEFFASDPPARVAIGVDTLPKGARVEIDAVVALPD